MGTADFSALEDERLIAIEPHTLTARYPRTIGRNARLGSHGTGPRTTALAVHTTSGHTGWGLAADVTHDLRDCIGRPLRELFDVRSGLRQPAPAALDVALHDLAGRILGVPVYQLIGGGWSSGPGSGSVACYSGGIYFDDLDPADAPRGIGAVLENCAEDWAAGYRAVKLKIGRGHRWMDHDAGLARDIAVTHAVREAYPEARILVDANDGYTPAQTVEYLRAVYDCDLFWIEEPFPEEAAGLGLVREYLQESGSNVLVADGELEPDEQQVLELAGRGLIDVVLMDVLTYGLTAWRRVMPLLAELGVAASPHAWGQPLKTAYAAQLAVGLGNVPIVEGVPGTTDGVDGGAYAPRDGVITVPRDAGFGLTLSAPPTRERPDPRLPGHGRPR